MRRCAGYDIDGIEGYVGRFGCFRKSGKWLGGFRCRFGYGPSNCRGGIEMRVADGDYLDIVKVLPEFDVTSRMTHSHAARAD